MEPGDRIDGWVVDRRLGTGGMGSVYRCRNASTDRILAAVKVLESPLRSSEEAQARFAREAHILARLDHPGIVRVRNVRIDADPPYLEMEFIEGESLEPQIREGPMAYAEARDVLVQVADAVRYLHDAGVRHRDLKPANLIRDPSGRVRIVDFGLATETELARITAEGLNFGTVSYAPPEWIDPAKLDPVQWDLYAMGVLFHELLTGKQAFPMSGEGPVRKQLLQIMMHKQAAPPLDPGPSFPEPARALIRELTAPTPSGRPRSADEVHARLVALPHELPDGPVAVRRGRGWILAPIVGVVLAGTIGLGWWLWPSPPPPPPPPEPAPLVLPSLPATRTVGVTIEGAGDVPVRVRAGDAQATASEGRATLDLVPAGATEVVWVAGDGCEVCPGDECPAWCGSGTLPLVPGEEPAELVASVVPGKGSVRITLPLLADEVEGGPFRKKKPIWHVSGQLDGTPAARPNHWTFEWDDVVAGRHEVVASIGGCREEARGCWPDGQCPSSCRSARIEVVVPWAGGSVAQKIRMPPPP